MKWKGVKKLRKFDRGDVLERLGLEERTPVSDFFTGLGLLAVGVAVGAGLGVLFAPRTGAEMRGRLSETIRKRAPRATQEFERRMGLESSAPSAHAS
jgi:hypothetical protein